MEYNPYSLLFSLLKKGTVPHAFLFTGIKGIGKRTAAKTFAMACNCRKYDPDIGDQAIAEADDFLRLAVCGQCSSCKKILSGNHPDISLIEPSGPFIRIAPIRELCRVLSLKPYQADMRVAIIADAQSMNPEAGNALLKMLEEPPDRTVLILTAAQEEDLLPTLVSRCRHLRFHPIPQERLRTFLIEKQGISSDEADLAARLAQGSYSKALAISRGSWLKRRKWLIRELECLTAGAAEESGRLLVLAEKLSKHKDRIPDDLEIIRTWLRDALICKYDPEKIINRDLTERIRNLSQRTSSDSLLSKLKALESAQKNLRTNANSRLTMEVMLMRLAVKSDSQTLKHATA